MVASEMRTPTRRPSRALIDLLDTLAIVIPQSKETAPALGGELRPLVSELRLGG
jgi:hypothetical protein